MAHSKQGHIGHMATNVLPVCESAERGESRLPKAKARKRRSANSAVTRRENYLPVDKRHVTQYN